jgi:hypothetical protein
MRRDWPAKALSRGGAEQDDGAGDREGNPGVFMREESKSHAPENAGRR